jgi:hypothetical protein
MRTEYKQCECLTGQNEGDFTAQKKGCDSYYKVTEEMCLIGGVEGEGVCVSLDMEV